MKKLLITQTNIIVILILYTGFNVQAQFIESTDGTLTTNDNVHVDGNLRWGAGSSSAFGDGYLSLSSGWSASGNYPTLGSINGSAGSLIMLHNPHIPFRTDNSASGFSGRAGIRVAIDQSASKWWDIGLAGDFFHIYRNGSGEFFRITNSGSVGIGTSTIGSHKLAVNGSIRAKEITVDTDWADFVFKENYQLRDLKDVESFINDNKHLPDIPSEKEVKEKGVSLGEMDAKLLQKIEELTLYVIQLSKENNEFRERLKKLETDK